MGAATRSSLSARWRASDKVSGVHWFGMSFGGRAGGMRLVRSAPGFQVPSEGTITGSGLAVSLPSSGLRDVIL